FPSARPYSSISTSKSTGPAGQCPAFELRDTSLRLPHANFGFAALVRVTGLEDFLAHQGAGIVDLRIDEAHAVVGLVDVAPDFDDAELALALERPDGRKLLDRVVDRKAVGLLVTVEGKQCLGPFLGLRRAFRRSLGEAGGTDEQGYGEPHQQSPGRRS